MTTVYVELQESLSGSLQLFVKECPFCQKRHYHGIGEWPRDSPCTYSEDGFILQGGTYDFRIDWTDPAHAELKEKYSALTDKQS
ncbi:hypothetical protein H9649_12030 [Sporosarcina sp. Sa2YVA2]|uniref:Uncharacterized protein n=1 Tax=Sporosarcina quadrami TaxID=2762234 RepID=A0ABR8UC87_9BACL|nr:hypothetical protein [Sporosarcina quadrami]MBD7985318.1 hypothetical protein [Sporosarcina quadrami]